MNTGWCQNRVLKIKFLVNQFVNFFRWNTLSAVEHRIFSKTPKVFHRWKPHGSRAPAIVEHPEHPEHRFFGGFGVCTPNLINKFNEN